MMDAIIAEHHFDKSRTLMVGGELNQLLASYLCLQRLKSMGDANWPDNILTDIAFATNSGIRALLVLGGVTHEDQVWGPKASDIKPTYVMGSLGDFATLEEA